MSSSEATLPPAPTRYTVVARWLHWAMAVMVIAILFIGVFMVTSIAEFNFLVTVHEPLGIAIFIFVLVRIGWRRTHTPPPFPAGMSPLDRLAAMYSERLLYALLLCQPLIGWAMVSASGQPVIFFRSLHLPAIAPQNATLFANLLRAHILAAYLLYLTFAAHLAGVLLHTIVIRDRVLDRMAFWGTPRSSRVAADGRQSVPSSRNSAPGS
ncbi:MAG: cytochrome [Pseudonocardia sp.]|nr:cytochrome [Pseudonocardia sp.]